METRQQTEHSPDLEAALQRCASEQIHFINRIQPHGVLIVCERKTPWTIHQVSENITALTGALAPFHIGKPLTTWFDQKAISVIAGVVDELRSKRFTHRCLSAAN